MKNILKHSMCLNHSKRNKAKHLLKPQKEVSWMVRMMLIALYSMPTILLLSSLFWLRALVGSKGHHMAVTINIPVNRMARRGDGNIGKYARGRCRRGHPWDFFP
jgi:hypothetical protein